MKIYKHPIKYDLFDFIFSLGNSAKAREKLFENIKDQKVLEVGIGTGKSLKYLKNKGNEIYGIEPFQQMLDIAKKRAKSLKINPENMILGSAYSLPFPDNFFDKVFFVFTICVLDNPKQAIKEALRVGKKVLILEYQKPKHWKQEIWGKIEKQGNKTYGSQNHNIDELTKDFKLLEKIELKKGLFTIHKLTSPKL